MGYEQDWIMRQVHSIVSFIIYLMIGKKPNEDMLQNFEKTTLSSNILYSNLKDLISQGKIDEAENKLFDSIDTDLSDKNAFYAGILFYSEINNLSNEKLREYNFPREEILNGLKEICSIYGFELGALDIDNYNK